MKILVPTDFSKNANNALEYALEISLKIPSEIILFHGIYVPLSAASSLKKLDTLFIKEADERLKAAIKRSKSKYLTNIKPIHRSVIGNPITVIEKVVKENNVDMIVMGTKGASGIKKSFIGSNTSGVIEYSSCPVIAVPENATFTGISNIVYPSDFKNLSSEIAVLIAFAKALDSNIHVVHVSKDESSNNDTESKKINSLKKMMQYEKLEFHSIVDKNIVIGIDRYLEKNNTDLLAMFTEQKGFFTRFFDESVTREMVLHSTVPIFSFKKTI